MKEIKSMCATCHQPNEGGEGIEHDKRCPESDEQLTTNDNMKCTIKNLKLVSEIIRDGHLDNQMGSDTAQFDDESDLLSAVENVIEQIKDNKETKSK